jgi:hypothetical protein
MGQTWRSVAACLLTLFAAAWPADSFAADGPPAEVLKRKGLKAHGPLYVLEGEDEAKKKLAEYRQIARKLGQALQQQASVPTPEAQQQMIQDLNAQVGQIRAEINAVNQQMRRTPRARGRFSGYYNQQQNAELNAYSAELNTSLSQQNQLITRVRNQKIDPKLKDKIDAEVKTLRDQRLMAARELETTVKSTREKYAGLASDVDVQKALAALALAAKPSPQLGPSREFHEIARLADKLDRDLSESPVIPGPRSAHKAKHATKSSAP